MMQQINDTNSKVMNWRRLFIFGAIALTGICVTVVAIKLLSESAQCRRRLLSAYSSIVIYKTQHNGRYPADLVAVATFRGAGLGELTPSQTNLMLTSMITCGGVRAHYVTLTNASQEADYVYMHWDQFVGTNYPGNYPLIYDRRMQNHYGLGVNVLLTSGERFWDFRGRWLRKFAREHPEYKLRPPE